MCVPCAETVLCLENYQTGQTILPLNFLGPFLFVRVNMWNTTSSAVFSLIFVFQDIIYKEMLQTNKAMLSSHRKKLVLNGFRSCRIYWFMQEADRNKVRLCFLSSASCSTKQDYQLLPGSTLSVEAAFYPHHILHSNLANRDPVGEGNCH